MKETHISLNPEDYGKGKKSFAQYVKKNEKVFGGVFDVNCLSFDGSVLPIVLYNVLGLVAIMFGLIAITLGLVTSVLGLVFFVICLDWCLL